MHDVNSEVSKWAQKIGYRKAVSILFEAGISARVSELLAQGRYHRNPGQMLRNHIEKAMKKTTNRRKENERP